jgi:hypothetical protein
MVMQLMQNKMIATMLYAQSVFMIGCIILKIWTVKYVHLNFARQWVGAPLHWYAHPNMVLHLKSYVTSRFASYIIVPILKDRSADVGNIDNYGGIILCNLISKVFEIRLLYKFESYLGSHQLHYFHVRHKFEPYDC